MGFMVPFAMQFQDLHKFVFFSVKNCLSFFFTRKMLMSAFLLRFKASYSISKKCVATPLFLCGFQ